MNLGDSIPKINSIAILLIVVFILNIVATPILSPYLTRILTPSEYGDYTTSTAYATFIRTALSSLLNIVVAIWTYREATKQNERPLTWTVFALFFGLIAVIAFYLILLIKEIKLLNASLENRQNNNE
ncbi:MAG: hypothetical protein K8H85_02175 [Cyclobacteriaceae bacterium]|jgi:O-antigen/teichoic acid export membrane protein|nr:hypothetical protein [Cyclobacteriaceae bacterium]